MPRTPWKPQALLPSLEAELSLQALLPSPEAELSLQVLLLSLQALLLSLAAISNSSKEPAQSLLLSISHKRPEDQTATSDQVIQRFLLFRCEDEADDHLVALAWKLQELQNC